MEKYSRWRDPGTGIHPFLILKSKVGLGESPSLPWKLKSYLLGPILALIRLPFVIVGFAWLFLIDLIASLIPVPVLPQLIRRASDLFVCRILFFLCGFFWVPTRYIKITQKAPAQSEGRGSDIKAGDVLVCNHLSYIDLLYLSFRYSPLYTAVPNAWPDEQPPQGVAIERSFLGAFWDSIRDPVHTSDTCVPIAELRRKAEARGCPLVVFPEGTTSNGKTLLSCVPVLDGLVDEKNIHTRIHIVALKYEYEDFNPSFTVGNFFMHLFRLLCQVHNVLEVRYVKSTEIPPVSNFQTKLYDDQSGVEEREKLKGWSDTVYSFLATALRVKRAKLGAKDKLEFRDYYYGHTTQYKKQKEVLKKRE